MLSLDEQFTAENLLGQEIDWQIMKIGEIISSLLKRESMEDQDRLGVWVCCPAAVVSKRSASPVDC